MPQAVTFDGSDLHVTNTSGSSITEVNPADGAKQKTIIPGQGPGAIVAAGPSLSVTNPSDKTVSEFRSPDGVKIGTFPVGGHPARLANLWPLCLVMSFLKMFRSSLARRGKAPNDRGWCCGTRHVGCVLRTIRSRSRM